MYYLQIDANYNTAFRLFDLDWSVFSPHLEGGIKRLPALEKIGLKSTVCGAGKKLSITH